MNHHELTRRDFSQLTMAAFGGMLAGAGVAHADEDKKTGKKSPLLYEPHICRGLNICKAKGKGKDNACAGQSNCATIDAHSCKGQNDCRGQGPAAPSPARTPARAWAAARCPSPTTRCGRRSASGSRK